MKRMINSEIIKQIVNLFTSVESDDMGNLTIGKNLEVDGNFTLNSATDFITKDGSSLGGKLYQHNVYCIDNGSKFNTYLHLSIINSNPNPFTKTELFNYLKSNVYGHMIAAGTITSTDSGGNILYISGNNTAISVYFLKPNETAKSFITISSDTHFSIDYDKVLPL